MLLVYEGEETTRANISHVEVFKKQEVKVEKRKQEFD
jgi:hypothetical protein